MRASRQSSKLASGRLPPLRLLLAVVFSLFLLIPLAGRWRRRSWWNRFRVALSAGAALLLAAGASGAASALANPFAVGVALAALLFALACRPAPGPGRERALQRRHGAQYLLNGGTFAAGAGLDSAGLELREPLYLLVRGGQLLVVSRHGPGEAAAELRLHRLAEIRVNGEIYAPVYVSEAKDPPVRNAAVDRKEFTLLELRFAGGQDLCLAYEGPFGKHVAETAAHTLHSIRSLELGGAQQPSQLRVIPAR